MNDDWRHELLTAVNSYCASAGRARSGLGTLILNDPKFFERIEEGRGCTMDKYQKVMLWLKRNSSHPKSVNRRKSKAP